MCYGEDGQSTISETTNELDPLKGLTRLLTLVEVMGKGEENHWDSRVLFGGAIGETPRELD